MKQHEREYFISRIRSGVYIINDQDLKLKLKIYAPTIEGDPELCEVYNSAYAEAFEEGVMLDEEMLAWMDEKGLWTQEDKSKVKGLEEDLERLKVEIYNSRYNYGMVEQIRKGLRIGERQLQEQVAKKGHFKANTCEGMAGIEKARALIRQTTYLNGELYDFESLGVDEVLSAYNATLLQEVEMRELVVNDPWKLVWYMRDVDGSQLFVDQKRQLTPDQKNIIVWSRMYDSVQESTDCPSDDVIKDQDMLDGWFIIQRRKREKDRSDKEFETENEKISGADEVFMVAKDPRNVRRIKDMNDINARMRIKEREAVLKSKGNVTQADFRDVQLDMRNKSSDMYKDKFKN